MTIETERSIDPAEHNRIVASRWIDAFNARDDTAEAAARKACASAAKIGRTPHDGERLRP
jgi:hypothetical protein